MRRLPYPVYFLLIATAFAGIAAAQAFVGVSFTGSLTRISRATGVGTPLGSTGFSWEGGLARIGDVLYTNDAAGRIWHIDPWTGATTPGPVTSPVLNAIRAMAAHPYGRLWVIQDGPSPGGTLPTPDRLYEVEPATGAATLIGSTSSFIGVQGLAFDRTGNLYGWDVYAGLVVISTSTAATTDVNPSVGATAYIQDIAFAPDGTLFGARDGLFTIDQATGVTTPIGSGGYSDVRGLTYVHGPRIYDNGPFVTHPGGGFGGAGLSMQQTSLGLNTDDTRLTGAQSVLDDFRTTGLWLVDAIEIYGTNLDRHLHLQIEDDPLAAQPVPGSPSIATDLSTQTNVLVTYAATGVYRAPDTNPTSTALPVDSVRVQFAQPLLLNSAALASGRYLLRWSEVAPIGLSRAIHVTTLGVADTGDALYSGFLGFVSPLQNNGHPQALPFVLYGTSLTPPGGVTPLGGGCGPTSEFLAVRGATCAGGTVVHEVTNGLGFPAIVIGFADPNAPFAPLCGCVLHAALDFVALGTFRYDLVAPPGVGTGFAYRVQGLRVDFTGLSGLPCDLGLGFDFQLSDAYHVRFW